MSIKIETLEGLQRKVNLALDAKIVESEVSKRLYKLAKTTKMDGFRPGKVPVSIVAQRYGYSVQHEVLNEQISVEFSKLVQENNIPVAGSPTIKELEDAKEQDKLLFEAVFEVLPEVKITDLDKLQIEKVIAPEVEDTAINKTLDILRTQQRSFKVRQENEAVVVGDRVKVDFEGKIDGEIFEGGKAEGFSFIVGEGQMLKEFDQAVVGMKQGDSKTFPLNFPENYHGKEVAGKQADFLVTVKQIEAAILPEINEELIKNLGVADGKLETLKADIVSNLEREVKNRTLTGNKKAVMDALIEAYKFDLPKVTVQNEIQNLIHSARQDLHQRGFKDAEKVSLPEEMFKERAEQRARLSLIVMQIIKEHQIKAQPDQVNDYLTELASSYEQPQEMIDYYKSDAKRMAELSQVVLENNLVDFVLSKAQITEKKFSFDELMALNN